MTTDLQTLRDSILSLHASIVTVHGPTWLHFEPIKLLNFDFNAQPDTDQDFRSNVDPILIHVPKIMRTHEDPDPQPWLEVPEPMSGVHDSSDRLATV